ncbi:MAG: PKD domain-containing protein [Bacteroidales bacterium]|nr:PKD domain-containing protein [Lentimicrobiaceae bacterium]MDD5693889.1 PKD domain-containing protein [Bacteroidales bacterium]
MKKFTFLFSLLLLGIFLNAQNVPREKVVIEISTCTYCTYCPGAAGAADQLFEEGKDVAIIEYHDTDQGPDPFANGYSTARQSYYGMSGNPTARFDGVLEHVGGQACPPPFTNVYNIYLNRYNQRIGVSSPYTISWYGQNNSGNNWTVYITVTKVGTVETDNTFVQFAVTESDIQQNWLCMTEVDFVNRLMVPSQTGTPLNLQSNQQLITLNFNLDPSWDTDHIEFVCFIQRNTGKEIHQAIVTPLNELPPPPLEAGFTADNTIICETNTVQFTDQSLGIITSRQWTFPGGTPNSSTQEDPAVVYSTAGTYDVTLKVFHGTESDELTKPAYIQVSATAPNAPDVPVGESQLCKNPPNGTYTANGSPSAITYDWELTPSTAGLVMNDGNQTVTVNWVNAFTGEASLTVKAINGCGESAFSEPLGITISQRPTVYNVTGGGEFCEEGTGVEVGLDNSAAGITYELYKDDTPTGNIVDGNGSPISFGWVTEAGEYTVIAFDPVTACDNTMASAATVTVIPKPVAFAVTGGGEYCEGGEGVHIGLEGSQINCAYELFCNDVSTGVVVTGTGEALDFGLFTTLGTYTATAVDTEASCTSTMNGTAGISLAPYPETPATPDGPTYVDLYYSTQTEYETTGSEFSDYYSWLMEPSDAGSIEVLDITHCRVSWNLEYLGQVEILTEGVNECGESDWSAPIVVTIDNTVGFNTLSDHFGIKVSPNPSDGIFTIQMKSETQEIISIRVISALNLVAFEENKLPVNGSLTKTIDLGHVPNGVYFLYIETEQCTYMRKLIFQ